MVWREITKDDLPLNGSQDKQLLRPNTNKEPDSNPKTRSTNSETPTVAEGKLKWKDQKKNKKVSEL